MKYEFWDMMPCEELFEAIRRLPSLVQRLYFLSVAEDCKAYNEKYDTFLKFGEYMAMYRTPSSSLDTSIDSDEQEEEPY